MKILFPISIFYPVSKGGPSNSVFWLVKYLNENSVETFVVTTNYKFSIRESNITLNRWIKNAAGNVIYCKTKLSFLPFKAIWNIIKKIIHVDIVHYSSFFDNLTIYTFFISIVFRRIVIISPRGELFSNAINKSLKKIIVIKVFKMVQSKIIFHSTSTEESQEILLLFPKSKIFLIPNLVDLEIRKKDFLPQKNIVFLGLIYEVKKIENLIKAISLSQNFNKNNSKLLIGGLPLKSKHEKYLAYLKQIIIDLNLNNKVEFLGELQGQKKVDFLHNAFILVLPSTSENFGNVVLESLAQGTPVIASKGTPWQILEYYHAGWWVSNDPKSLSIAIDSALSLNENDYSKMSINSINLISDKYQIRTSQENKWKEIYTRLINFKTL
jgi:glycosyltransferase involved in cell wall biosynthesis